MPRSLREIRQPSIRDVPDPACGFPARLQEGVRSLSDDRNGSWIPPDRRVIDAFDRLDGTRFRSRVKPAETDNARHGLEALELGVSQPRHRNADAPDLEPARCRRWSYRSRRSPRRTRSRFRPVRLERSIVRLGKDVDRRHLCSRTDACRHARLGSRRSPSIAAFSSGRGEAFHVLLSPGADCRSASCRFRRRGSDRDGVRTG